jgi:hypothetical protein
MTGRLTLKRSITFPHVLRKQTQEAQLDGITRIVQQERIRGNIGEVHDLLSLVRCLFAESMIELYRRFQGLPT